MSSARPNPRPLTANENSNVTVILSADNTSSPPQEIDGGSLRSPLEEGDGIVKTSDLKSANAE